MPLGLAIVVSSIQLTSSMRILYTRNPIVTMRIDRAGFSLVEAPGQPKLWGPQYINMYVTFYGNDQAWDQKRGKHWECGVRGSAPPPPPHGTAATLGCWGGGGGQPNQAILTRFVDMTKENCIDFVFEKKNHFKIYAWASEANERLMNMYIWRV